MILENTHFKASFVAKGAELRSFVDKATQKNFIWNANPQYWAKTSPILFPFVGALQDNTYKYLNKSFAMPRHGFARDCIFQLESQTETELVFLLNETHSEYPFEYELRVIYHLLENGLSCTYEICNPSEENTLWYSVGAHPAFAIETGDTINYSDYYITFDKDSVLEVSETENGLIRNNTFSLNLDDQKLPLCYELFYKDALVMKQMQSRKIQIKNTKNSESLDFEFKNLPFFGIWAAKNANFVCLEPWAGIADSTTHNKELEKKEGMMALAPQKKQTHAWSFKIT